MRAAAALLCLVTSAVFAQAPGDPLTLIRIIRKPATLRDPIGNYTRSKPPVQVYGMQSITGSSQTWLVETLGTYAALEETDRALSSLSPGAEHEDDMLAPPLAQLGLYRHALSYRPQEAVKLMPQARYLQVAIYRGRPGFDLELNQLISIRKAILDRVNVDRPELGYQIISGGTTGVYVFFAPLISTKSLDEYVARALRYDFAPQGGGRASQQIAAEGDITREEFLFRMEPRFSWTPENMRR